MVVMPASIYGFGGDAALRFNSMEEALRFAEGLKDYLVFVGDKNADNFPVELIAISPCTSTTLGTLAHAEHADDDACLLVPGGLFDKIEVYMKSKNIDLGPYKLTQKETKTLSP